MRALLGRLGLLGRAGGGGLEETKMVIVVRADIPMGKGKVAAQCAHAAVSLYRSASEASLPELRSWTYSGQPKVILKVSEDCEGTMTEVYAEARRRGLNACLIYDAGRTQVEAGTLTAVGIGPSRTEDIDKITSRLKLL